MTLLHFVLQSNVRNFSTFKSKLCRVNINNSSNSQTKANGDNNIQTKANGDNNSHTKGTIMGIERCSQATIQIDKHHRPNQIDREVSRHSKEEALVCSENIIGLKSKSYTYLVTAINLVNQ